MFSSGREEAFDRYREQSVPDFEWRAISHAKEQLEAVGWTVEPVREGVRGDVSQPWFEMTHEIRRDIGIEQMQNFILNQRPEMSEWPQTWTASIEADIKDAKYLPEIEKATYYLRLGYTGGRKGEGLQDFLEFTERITEAFTPRRTWRQRWLGRIGLHVDS